MRDLSERIGDALQREEARAERFANTVRLVLMAVLGAVALLNSPSLSTQANLMNFGALATGIAYGALVSLRLSRRGYHPAMKYVTSCADVVLLFLLLLLYTRIEIPSVALKNYVFLIVFPLVGLTAFRYDRTLTITVGALSVGLYLALLAFLYRTHAIALTAGGYERELFSDEVTYVGQLTKVLILGGFILLLSYLAGYSRRLIGKLVSDELNARHEKEQADIELALASDVQRRFLPGEVPMLAGLDIHGTVEQGKLVGGDYFDVLPLDGQRVLVVSADVSGNGMPAALVMAEVRAGTHLLGGMDLGLEAFLRRMNALIHQSTEKKRFVTLFAAEIDVRYGVLRSVSAGHPLPLVCGGNSSTFLPKGTVPLGVLAELPNVVVQERPFARGSTLVAYTDGLPEQMNKQGELFGEERVRACVERAVNANADAESFARLLLDEAKSFSDGGELSDDVSVLVVRYAP